jgi:hypothetical protein
VRLGDEAEPIDQPLHHDLGLFDPLGNFHFLLAGQQRHLAHLLEIHPHRVVEDVELRLGLLLFLFLGVLLAILVAIDLGRLDDVDLHPAQTRQDCIELIGVADVGRQRFIEIVEREITLFLGELDQLPNAALHIAARSGRQNVFRPGIIRAIQCFCGLQRPLEILFGAGTLSRSNCLR